MRELGNKVKGIYLHQSAMGDIPLTAQAAGGGLYAITALGATGSNLLYQIGGGLPALGDDLSTWTALPGDGVIAANAGDTVHVAASIGGKAALASAISL